MAFAPGAGAPKASTRAHGQPQTNGRPTSRRPVAPPQGGSRPAVTFLAGLGIGLAIGAAAGMLLAPITGADARRALRNRGKKIGNRARDAWEDLRIELEATRRALKRKRRDAKIEIEEEQPAT